MIKVRKFGFIMVMWVSMCCLFEQAKAQNVPIFLDGRFDDWFNITSQYSDPTGDVGSAFGLDLLDFSMTNNKDYLFIRLQLNQNIKLIEDNDLFLYLDTDNNSQTGKTINGIGAEIGIDFGNRLLYMYPANSLFTYNFDRIGFRNLPTVSGFEHEIALSRHTLMPNNTTPVFSNSAIKALFKDESTFNGDAMPNNGSMFTYSFEENTPEINTNINIERSQENYLRLMTYNTLQNGLTDGSRAGAFRRIIQAVQPDIITFNECWDVTATYAKNFMDNALSLPNGFGWYTVKLDDGNITASRYPILQSWEISAGYRLTASHIQLPIAIFPKDILVVNAHFKCCGDGDARRQVEADTFAAFIKDAKTVGGRIDLPENTPFVLAGDLNLVGSSQPLTTLLTGDIVNDFVFGEGVPLDWDDSELEDVVSPQTGDYMAFTWLGEDSSFPAGRLDFMIHSNSVMEAKKAYTLNTTLMPPQDLDYYNLNATDTYIASDHLPKVTDFEITISTDIAELSLPLQLTIQPNPFEDVLQIHYQIEGPQSLQWQLFNATGQMIWQMTTHDSSGNVELSELMTVSGVYLLKANNLEGREQQVWRLLKM